jgi:hypothetical protein
MDLTGAPHVNPEPVYEFLALFPVLWQHGRDISDVVRAFLQNRRCKSEPNGSPLPDDDSYPFDHPIGIGYHHQIW